MTRKRILSYLGKPGRGPYACLTPGCGLVYTPGYWREHVKAYHRKPVKR
jgi:hypothetical protein